MQDNRARLSELTQEYTALLSQPKPSSYRRAYLENAIWDTRKQIEGIGVLRKGGERREWFTAQFGGEPSAYEVRFTIYRAGEWAHKLFDLIDKDVMKMHAAKSIVHRAKVLARQTCMAPGTAIDSVIKQYDGSTKSIQTAQVRIVEPEVQVTPEELEAGNVPVTTSKLFKRHVLLKAKELATNQLNEHNVEQVFVDKTVHEFETEIDRAVKDFLLNIARLKGKARKDSIEAIGLVRFNSACETLGVNAQFGKSLTLDRLRKAYRRRAASLQRRVDAGGSAAAERELKAVNQAYEILRTYSKQEGSNSNGK